MVTDETLAALRHELMRLSRRRDSSGCATGLDVSAFRILWVAVEHGPHTLRGLAERLQLEQSTINRQVHAAEGHGLVERREDPAATGLLVHVTPAGEAAYAAESRARAEGLREVVDLMDEAEVVGLAAGLAGFNDAVDAAIEADVSRGSSDGRPARG